MLAFKSRQPPPNEIQVFLLRKKSGKGNFGLAFWSLWSCFLVPLVLFFSPLAPFFGSCKVFRPPPVLTPVNHPIDRHPEA